MNTSSYFALPKKNYAGQYRLGDANIPCYSKKQMNSLYPHQDYLVLGEIAPKSGEKAVGTLKSDDGEYEIYPYLSHNRRTHAEKGFVAVDGGEDQYVALLKNNSASRYLIMFLSFIVIVGLSLALPSLNTPSNTESPTTAPTAVKQPTSEPIMTDQPTAEAIVAPTPTRALELEEGAVAWEGVHTEDTGGVTQGIAIPGYKSITIDANTTDVSVNLQNPEGNPCYFIISLLLDDGTKLYESKMVSPGMGLYEITLTQPLTPGEYPATIKYETYSLEGLNPLNGAEVKITLIAQ